MKKALCVLLVVLLVATAALTLTACGEKQDGPATYVSAYKSKGEYQAINDPLTWEKINSFPIVSDETTIEEGRDMVVDFFRFAKTALWVPAETYEYVDGAFIEGGTIFGGLPYISLASGTIYRLMDYMDEETHVVDSTQACLKPTLHGNQCSFGSFVGYGRVINSTSGFWTVDMVESRGFLPLGGYTYDRISGLNGGVNTKTILEQNGQDKMNECYALLKHGDGIVNYTTAGHVIMISGDAHVERDASGKVDAGKSYVTIIDQTHVIAQATNEAGDTYNYEQNVDVKYTFLYLFQKNYMPFTYAEWTGEDPIEKSVTTYSHEGDTMTLDQLYASKVTSNYAIGDIYAQIFDKNGNEVFKLARRAEEAGLKELAFKKAGFEIDTWGNLDDLDAKKDYTIKITAQLYTGERPVLWEGKLAK